MKKGDIIELNHSLLFNTYPINKNDFKVMHFEGEFQIYEIDEEYAHIEAEGYTGGWYFIIKIKDLEKALNIKTMQVNDLIELKEGVSFIKTKLSQSLSEAAETRDLRGLDFKIFKIQGNNVYFDRIDYTGNNYFVVTKAVFERSFNILSQGTSVTGYVLLKDTPDADAGTIVSSDGIYKDRLGNKAQYGKEFLTRTFWFKPTSAKITPLLGSNGIVLSREEGSDVVSIKGKTEKLSYEKIVHALTKFSASAVDLGGFTITLPSTERVFLVGCSVENNKVSIADLKLAVDSLR